MAAEETQFADASLADDFIEDTSAVPLPSFDDFAARDRNAAFGVSEVARVASEERQATRGPSFVPSVPKTTQEVARDRLMELLSFDTIDDRPTDELEYDWTARLIGRGLPNSAGVYPLPYLQSGHMLLLGVLLLSSFISYPGFPLTEVPDEFRGILLQGLGLTFLVNTATAAYAVFVAAATKDEPAIFWGVKCFLLGGLALGELTQAVPEPRRMKQQKRNGRR